jgi:hypothetical protein
MILFSSVQSKVQDHLDFLFGVAAFLIESDILFIAAQDNLVTARLFANRR